MGDQNPLAAKVCHLSDDSVKGIFKVANEQVAAFKGLAPDFLSILNLKYKHPYGGFNSEDAVVARWHSVHLTPQIVDGLEKLVQEMYAPKSVRTRRDYRGIPVKPTVYVSPEYKKMKSQRGYHFTPGGALGLGMYIIREFKSSSNASESFRREKGSWLYSGPAFVELRLDTDSTKLACLEFVVRSACQMTGIDPNKNNSIIYDLYRSLMASSYEKKQASELVGVDNLLDFLRWTMFAASEVPFATRYGLKNRSVMLAGVYGVGKTSVAKVLATENNGALFIPIDAPTLMSATDEKAENPNALFGEVSKLQKRSRVKVALFCDDIEAAMAHPDRVSQSPYQLAMASNLLNRLQGIGGDGTILSGSTNDPYAVDPRFLEFGRVGYVVHVPLPDRYLREKTFQVYTAGKPMQRFDFRQLIEKTAGFSNRAIEEVCAKAGESALRRASGRIARPGEDMLIAAGRLTEEIVSDFPITQDDFIWAYDLVSKYVRVNAAKELDNNISKFCESFNPKSLGF